MRESQFFGWALLSLLAYGSTIQGYRVYRSTPPGLHKASKSDVHLDQSSLERRQLASIDLPSSSDAHKISNLPQLPSTFTAQQYAGVIGVGPQRKRGLFYWFIKKEDASPTTPIVIWLNGGPGCSSMMGLFIENGPFRITKADAELQINPHSWHTKAHVLYLDQPYATGLSFSNSDAQSVMNEETYRTDFTDFLNSWFRLFPDMTVKNADQQLSTLPLYIFGESHAGRYIPYFADDIYQANAMATGSTLRFNLMGIGIGNGWIHPPVQYDNADYCHYLGFLTDGQVAGLHADYEECVDLLRKGQYSSVQCIGHLDRILSHARNSKFEPNSYDARTFVPSPNIKYPPAVTEVERYLNKNDVRKALHVTPDGRFQDCSDEVYENLNKFDGVSSLANLNSVLEKGLRVLIYSGKDDIICNHINTEKVLRSLDTPAVAEYHANGRQVWQTSDLDIGGFAKEGGNLTFLVVANSGHMVPMDQPKIALAMLDQFLYGGPFADGRFGSLTEKTGAIPDPFKCPAQTNNLSSSGPSTQAPTQANVSPLSNVNTTALIVMGAVVVGVILGVAIMMLIRRKFLFPLLYADVLDPENGNKHNNVSGSMVSSSLFQQGASNGHNVIASASSPRRESASAQSSPKRKSATSASISVGTSSPTAEGAPSPTRRGSATSTMKMDAQKRASLVIEANLV